MSPNFRQSPKAQLKLQKQSPFVDHREKRIQNLTRLLTSHQALLLNEQKPAHSPNRKVVNVFIQQEITQNRGRNSIFNKEQVLESSHYTRTQNNEVINQNPMTRDQFYDSNKTKYTNLKLASQNSTNYLEVNTFQDREGISHNEGKLSTNGHVEVIKGEDQVKNLYTQMTDEMVPSGSNPNMKTPKNQTMALKAPSKSHLLIFQQLENMPQIH